MVRALAFEAHERHRAVLAFTCCLAVPVVAYGLAFERVALAVLAAILIAAEVADLVALESH